MVSNRRLKVRSPSTYPQRDKLIIHRLRIGHTHLIYAFLLKREDLPECEGFQTPPTKHILLKCIEFQLIRAKVLLSANMSDRFNNVSSRAIVDFIKEIGLYWEL
jgi:hypothetical protein